MPYLAKTALLRRRLKRLLRQRTQPSRLLNLRDKVIRLEYWPSGSRIESSLVQYDLARRHLPDAYLDYLKLRMPPYVKLVLSNTFPRAQVTTRLSGANALYYGPFRTRGSAEAFEH